jgi:hypothetical protein
MRLAPAPIVLTVVMTLTTSPALRADSGERFLHDYTNDDGSRPDGSDSARDDSSAMKKALADGPGVVQIGRGYYRWGDIQIPEGVTVRGLGKATIVCSNGANAIFRQVNIADWDVRDLVLDGEATGDWKKRTDGGKSRLFIERCHGFEVAGVTARNFEGAGFQLTRSQGTDGGRLERLSATGCYVGVRFDIRGEYITASQLNCRNNVVGCVIHAGNTNISASNFCDNTDGMVIEDKENGSHGAISNCLFNHNARYALLTRKVEHGMAISNCCFFYGTLRVEDSAGINVTSSQLSCSVETPGEKANRFAGNYIIPLEWKFKFSEKDIVEGNFTKDGRWAPQ